jgi:CheY-like chemotaxis protein
VLAVDVDELTLGRVRAAVRETEFAVTACSREEALDWVQAKEARVILLLEWSEEEAAEGVRLCEALRRVARIDHLYIVALGGPADHAALLRATAGPTNDALSRPFDGDLLLLRLRQAVRVMRSATAAITPRDALEEALQHGSGEVCARSGATVARIHVQGGHIVWANVSSVPATMEDVAARGGVSLDADLVAAVKEECRAAGAHFMDVLVQWGVIEQDRAREAVRSFVTDQVQRILELPDAMALFLPRSRPQAHNERLRFRASEIPSLRPPNVSSTGTFLVEPPPPESRRAPALSLFALSDIVEAAMRTEGAIGAAVLERGTGACLHHAGAELDTQIAWSQVSALAALGPGAEEVLASAGERCFVTRPLRNTPSLMLFVSLASSLISLGLARAAIAAVAAQRAAPAPIRGSAVDGLPR